MSRVASQLCLTGLVAAACRAVPPPEPPPEWDAAAERQAAALTVEPSRGLAWERDPDWRIEGASVPHVWVREDGSFGLSFTNNIPAYDDHPRWMVTGDGVTWDEPRAAWWPVDFQPRCGEYLADMAVRVDPAGTYDYVFVGHTGKQSELCWLPGDAEHGGVAEGGPFTIEGLDGSSFGVPAFLVQPDGSALFYFILAETGHGGLYAARIERGATSGALVRSAPVVARGNIDPMPMYLDGGGVRLYHTVGDDLAARGIGYTELGDGAYAEATPELLLPSSGDCTKEPTGECLVDPAVVRLPDGRLVMYFGAIDYGEDGSEFWPTVQRAFAVD